MTIAELQALVTRRIRDGAHIDIVDAEVITPSSLTPEQKSALWLYAWSHQKPRHQRKLARGFLAELDGSRP